jgi:hypothetical protein
MYHLTQQTNYIGTGGGTFGTDYAHPLLQIQRKRDQRGSLRLVLLQIDLVSCFVQSAVRAISWEEGELEYFTLVTVLCYFCETVTMPPNEFDSNHASQVPTNLMEILTNG